VDAYKIGEDKMNFDLSSRRRIKSIYTVNANSYTVGNSNVEKITAVEKSGDMAYIIWYQIWVDKEVIREINSLHVEDVEYFPIGREDIPF